MRRLFLSLSFLTLTLFAVAACTSTSPVAPPAATPAPATNSPDEIVVLAAISEVVVGDSRLSFGIFEQDYTPIEQEGVAVKVYSVEGDTGTLKGEYTAEFRRLDIDTPHQHEGGDIHAHVDSRSFYLVPQVRFDKPGVWQAQMTVTYKGKPTTGRLAFQVVDKTTTPAVGAAAPATANATANTEPDLAKLTSRIPPEPLFHQVSVAEALQAHRPVVVTFATPAFCLSRMCGPVLEIVRSVALQYKDKADFVQIEPYNLALAREKGQLELVPESKEWGLRSEPWVFVVDAQGKVAAKFEGLLTPEELVSALQKVAQ